MSNGYTEAKLEIFHPLTDKNKLVGTAYFELHAGELPTEYACWLEGSLFIQDEAFNFFELCFERTVPNFDYFAFNRVTTEHVQALRRELSSFLAEIATSREREILFSRLQEHYPKDNWDTVSTDALRNAVTACGKKIQDYLFETERRGTVLNVLGM